MIGVYPVEQVRAAEWELMAVLPAGALMQRAAFALSVRCARVLSQSSGSVVGSRVVVLIGGGNNGADAMWAAVLLAGRGVQVSAILVTRTPEPTAAAAMRAAGIAMCEFSEECDVLIGSADLVVDGMTGIGAAGPLREPAASCARAANALASLVVSVDIPSGVDADTGAVAGDAVSADVTVTFGALKPGLLNAPGAMHCGSIDLVDIGLGNTLPQARMHVLDDSDIVRWYRPGTPTDHKYSRGVVLIAAGSAQYPGAGLLAVAGALSVGPGMVQILARAPRPSDIDPVMLKYPQIVQVADIDQRTRAILIGPGMPGTDAHMQLLTRVLDQDLPVILDAGALSMVAANVPLVQQIRQRSALTVMTPHDGELTALTGPSQSPRIHRAAQAARDFGAIVVHKGFATIIAGPDGELFFDDAGTPVLATAGSGDVLAGIIAASLAGHRGLDLPASVELVAAAVRVHSLAALREADGGPAISVADLPVAASQVVREMWRQGADERSMSRWGQ